MFVYFDFDFVFDFVFDFDFDHLKAAFEGGGSKTTQISTIVLHRYSFSMSAFY